MVIRYPNGKPYHTNRDKPGAKKQGAKKSLTHKNRGMRLEDDINQSIEYYRKTNQAIIHKKPTPVQIVNVDYPKRSAAKITEAYFRKASTTDYNGIYKGHYIDFEAKETKNKTSFPLKNFHQHQIDHMKQCVDQGGIVFVILYFSKLQKHYYFKAKDLFIYWDNQFKESKKKSIPLSEIKKLGIAIQIEISPRIPFLPVIDKIIQNND